MVIDVHSADEIASILILKNEIEKSSGNTLRLTLTGATEAHLLAHEIGKANIDVVLNPVRPYPSSWARRRM